MLGVWAWCCGMRKDKGWGVGGVCVCVCVCWGGGLRVYPDRLAINSMTVAVCLIVGALCK